MKSLLHSIIILLALGSSAEAAVRLYTQTGQPATCNVGDLWVDTNGTSGERLYTCESANTWAKHKGLGASDNVSFGDITSTTGILRSGVAGVTQGALILYTNTDPVYTFGIVPAALPTATVSLKAPPAMPIADNSMLNFDINGTGGWTDPATFQNRVSGTCSAGSSIREIAANGTVTCETDDTGSGSVPNGTVNGQVLTWSTDQWVAGTAPWLRTDALGTGVATALGFAPDTTGGFMTKVAYDAEPELAAGTGITFTSGAGTLTVSVTANTYQAYDANMITWPSAINATEVGYLDGLTGAISTSLGEKLDDTQLDDTKGNGDTTFIWSADKVYDQLGLKRSISDERKEIGWLIKDSDVVTAVADGKQAAVIPANMNGMLLVDFTCSVSDLNSAASGDTTVVLRRVRGATAVDMTSTGVTIGSGEYTASDETVDTANDDVATGDKIFVDVNAVTSPAHKGLGCTAILANP